MGTGAEKVRKRQAPSGLEKSALYTSSAEFCRERSTKIVNPSPRKNQKKDMSLLRIRRF